MMTRKTEKIKLGVSIGDLNGIGMEVILKTFKDIRMMDFCTPIIFGSNKIASIHRKAIDLEGSHFHIINNISEAKPNKANLLNCWRDDIEVTFGEATSTSAKYAFESLELACESLKKGNIDVLVTAPINKASIQEKIKDFVGHTEFLEKTFDGKALMIMVSDAMKIAFVTGHIPLDKVTESITTDAIISKTEALNHSLITDFRIRTPKIAIIGLNPHAGENGVLGSEENNIITPAIKSLKKNNIMAFGPYPSDSFFTHQNLSLFDGILSMYHDQGLTPFKTLSFSEGVNYTAGLNIIRTSPVHGTAAKIAGKGKATGGSFREAVFMACDIFKKRLEFKQLTENPLPVKKRK